MKALRIQVERVVRPIWASNLRKDRMREELLAHLTRLFEEELSRKGDAQSAAAEAIRRFGDASALTRELQASIPWLERWALVDLGGGIRRRIGESPVRYVLRVGYWALVVGIASYALVALIPAVAPDRCSHRADQISSGRLFVFGICAAAIQCAAVIGGGLLVEGIRLELERRTAAATLVERRKATWRTIGYAAANSALLGVVSAGMMLVIEGFIPVSFITRAAFWWITLGAIAVGPLFTLKQAADWRASTRRFDAWESLDLNEQPSST